MPNDFNLVIKLGSLALLVACLCGCNDKLHYSAVHGNAHLHDLSVVNQSSQNQYVELSVRMSAINAIDKPISVDFALTNNLNERITLNHRRKEDDIVLKLLDEKGEDVQLTDFGMMHTGGDGYEFTFNFPIFLTPSTSISWRYDLRKYFQIKAPGRYQLFASRTVDGYDTGIGGGSASEVNVGPIRFRVQ